MTKEQKYFTEKLQGKYSSFLEKLSKTLSKPEKNFLKDCCFGILSSQSCIVRRSAQSLRERISSKKTQERLTYHLDKPELNEKLSESLLQRQCCKLDNLSLILIDPSDIVKKYARKMEGLSRVRDGNDGKWKTGYDALDIVGLNKHDNNLTVFPIHSQLHSNAVEIDTMKNKLFDRIVDIIINSGNRGTFIFDRGFDDKKVIRELDQHNASYIIRMKKSRDVYKDGCKQNIKNVAENTKLCYHFRPQKNIKISAGLTSLNIPLNPHPVKNPNFANADLVVARIKSKDRKGKWRSGVFFLLCHLHKHNMTNRELVQFTLEFCGSIKKEFNQDRTL